MPVLNKEKGLEKSMVSSFIYFLNYCYVSLIDFTKSMFVSCAKLTYRFETFDLLDSKLFFELILVFNDL